MLSFPVHEYEYILVPLSTKTTLHLRDPATGIIQQFKYPYDNLPTFSSSAHPFHLAYNSLSYVLGFDSTLEESYNWGPPVCQALSQLSLKWIQDPPPAFCSGDRETASCSGYSATESGHLPLPGQGSDFSLREDYCYVDVDWIESWRQQTDLEGDRPKVDFDDNRLEMHVEDDQLEPIHSPDVKWKKKPYQRGQPVGARCSSEGPYIGLGHCAVVGQVW
ncbi:hypothetical protein D9758_005136 [Tetrapyrgos nigripes]|uniref:Uncharacterized protein n=1 Tax=Tetrapyrgos nigripes TaxID=182062 RepID=A0A8H5LWT3_9AGAR|nr:hypothetical protein D9758_005136 [Tetrapyrgos nigripes]